MEMTNRYSHLGPEAISQSAPTAASRLEDARDDGVQRGECAQYAYPGGCSSWPHPEREPSNLVAD
jgi:hypothetical protein